MAVFVAAMVGAVAMQMAVSGGSDRDLAEPPQRPRVGTGQPQPAPEAAQEARPIRGRRGWNLAAPLREFRADASGLITVNAEEVDRVELHLSSAGTGAHAGYLWDGTRLGPLPIGASLDAARGVFTWQPGVGFVGAYHFVFVRGSAPAPIRRDVRIVLHPKKSGRVGPQVVIDGPEGGQELVQPFTLSGWAIDLDDPGGSGIELVQVWAHPLNGEPRVFLGAAIYGIVRAGVAELHGETFRNSGFRLDVNGLAPGAYDLAVVARSTAAGGVVPAVTVRVNVR